MIIYFDYDKKQVIQALRYHFISRPEIKIMIILVNVFAMVSAALFYFQKVTPLAFLFGSTLWFILMITFWFILPWMVYRQSSTFKDHFQMEFTDIEFTLGNERGSRTWSWSAVSKFVESPLFFYLYFDSRSFFLIPKSGCKDSDEIVALRHLIKSKVRI